MLLPKTKYLTPKKNRHSNKENHHQQEILTQSSSPTKKNQKLFLKSHRNACRTKVTYLLDERTRKIKEKDHPNLWVLSKVHLKKLQSVVIEGVGQRTVARRKISWSEQSQCIYFNERKSSLTIVQAQRHVFALES